MPGLREDDGYDDQDNAETFDEANLDDREQIGEMRGRLAAVIGPSSSIAPLEREACQRLDMALDVYVRRNPPA